ncbi:LysE family translocator [candidate division KSB1 bacterium]|nr:LysE family translocator [candidate division KSB1 bacterium]
MIYVISRGISQGRKAGVISAFGVTTGILIHTFLAAFGLAVVLKTSSVAFLIVKYIGAIYLLYLGIKSLISKESFITNNVRTKLNYRSIFMQGMLSNVFNPKIALFFLSFLPQFISAECSNTTAQMIILGFLFAFFGILFLTCVGYFSGRIGSWLTCKPIFTNAIRWITGSILIALGLRLAFLNRKIE